MNQIHCHQTRRESFRETENVSRKKKCTAIYPQILMLLLPPPVNAPGVRWRRCNLWVIVDCCWGCWLILLADLASLCRNYQDRIFSLEGEKWDVERASKIKSLEVKQKSRWRKNDRFLLTRETETDALDIFWYILILRLIRRLWEEANGFDWKTFIRACNWVYYWKTSQFMKKKSTENQ